MGATKQRKAKANPAPAADVLKRHLPDANEPEKQLLVLDFIRYREEGMPVAFDDLVAGAARRRAAAAEVTPSQRFAAYVQAFPVAEAEQTELLVGYVDMLATQPELTFRDFLAGIFQTDLFASESAPAEPVDSGPGPEAPETGPAGAAPRPPHPGDRPGPKPGTRTEGGTRARRTTGSTRKEAGTTDLTNSRVVYKTGDKLIYGVCTRDGGETVDILDDARDGWTNIRRDLIRPETGPVVWTIGADQYEQIGQMLTRGRGPWPDADENEILFELARRVTPHMLVVVTVHNATPQPFVDAYVYDESAAEGENDVPFEHRPPEDIVGDYTFQVPGLGEVRARVVVK